MEAIRELLYPLGYIASLAFGARFLLQWIYSELEQKCVVTRNFWKLSLLGNLFLTIHALVQLQFHVCLIQACHAIISWRNLNLMQDSALRRSLRHVLMLFLGAIASVVLGFLLQGVLFGMNQIEWFRMPSPPSNGVTKVGILWHLLGFIGLVIFSSRFWVQWWYAERKKVSELGMSFWWLSLGGGVLSLIYFVRIQDPVNIIGPAFGLIPYIRNLFLIERTYKNSREYESQI